MVGFYVGCQQQLLLLLVPWHSHQGALHKGIVEIREYKNMLRLVYSTELTTNVELRCPSGWHGVLLWCAASEFKKTKQKKTVFSVFNHIHVLFSVTHSIPLFLCNSANSPAHLLIILATNDTGINFIWCCRQICGTAVQSCLVHWVGSTFKEEALKLWIQEVSADRCSSAARWSMT